MRQQHHYASIQHVDKIETPPDNYEPDTIRCIYGTNTATEAKALKWQIVVIVKCLKKTNIFPYMTSNTQILTAFNNHFESL